ncbi:MAG TPA: response regulator [Planctomycetota bacterium]|nr:response regulator [Planctomycetota bacterium]
MIFAGRLPRPGLRVLVVEDQPSGAVAQGFRKLGCDVEVVADGLDGFRRASRGSFDVVALRASAGESGAMSCLDTLRAMSLVGIEAPILVVGAEPGSSLAAEFLASGAKAVLATV